MAMGNFLSDSYPLKLHILFIWSQLPRTCYALAGTLFIMGLPIFSRITIEPTNVPFSSGFSYTLLLPV